MRRKDIKGFTLKIFNRCIEFVFIKYRLKTISIYDEDNIKLIKNIEV